MARTLLEIAREAAERDTIAPAPTTLFDTNDRIARILRTAAKDCLREYLRSSAWEGLSEFHSSWVFPLVPGRYAYQLPPDFLRVIPRTEQRDGWSLGLLGPATPQFWAQWLHGGSAISAPMGWRVRNNALFIEPTPRASELVVIEYISRYPVVSEIRAGDYDMTKSPPQTFAPVVPRDGWLADGTNGLIVSSGDGDFEYGADPGFDVGVWPAGPEEILKRIDPNSSVDPLPQVRRPEFTANTDLPAFEDDYPLSIGLSFRLARALGKPYAEYAAEWEAELEMKHGTDAGRNRSFCIGGDYSTTGTAVPLGGGRWLVD